MSDTQPLGRPALKVNIGHIPAFTAEEMRAYLQSTPSCSFGPTLSGEPPHVESIEFVSCKELTNRLNLYIGLADDAPVCHVVLRGPFVLRDISTPPGHTGPAYSEIVEEIYDASTGNLLVRVAGSSKPKPGY